MNASTEDVLLIEDDLNLAKTFSEALEEDDIHCCVALGANAVEVAVGWQPSLILLDAGSSYRMEGLAILEGLRGHRFTARLPVVILSGNTDRYVIERLRAHGVVDYWALQELSPETLVRRVRRWFEASPKARPHREFVTPLHPSRN